MGVNVWQLYKYVISINTVWFYLRISSFLLLEFGMLACLIQNNYIGCYFFAVGGMSNMSTTGSSWAGWLC